MRREFKQRNFKRRGAKDAEKRKVLRVLCSAVSENSALLNDAWEKGRNSNIKINQILFQFKLPQLRQKVNIDYAELSFGVNLTAPASEGFLEILSPDSSGKFTNYNAVPVTGLLPKNKAGQAQVDPDITQLVDLWVNGVQNKGILLVSHRKLAQKALQTGMYGGLRPPLRPVLPNLQKYSLGDILRGLPGTSQMPDKTK